MASLRVLWQQLCATPSALIIWVDAHLGLTPQPVICHAFGVFNITNEAMPMPMNWFVFTFSVCVLFLPLRILNNKQNK